MRATMNDDTDRYTKMMETLNIFLSGEERQPIAEPLKKRSMQIWIGASDTLLEMMVMRFLVECSAEVWSRECDT